MLKVALKQILFLNISNLEKWAVRGSNSVTLCSLPIHVIVFSYCSKELVILVARFLVYFQDKIATSIRLLLATLVCSYAQNFCIETLARQNLDNVRKMKQKQSFVPQDYRPQPWQHEHLVEG